jgi:methionyl-tRNA formyltransferase
MTLQKPGIVFMGTPRFAVPSLDILIQNGYPVKAVVTAVDKPSGRGLKIRESDVKRAAIASGIPVLQPPNLKDEGFERKLRELSADLYIVVAFRMLPENVWSIPPMGTVNLHASLLPSYRGAAPVNHAIINGEKVSGVTTFLIEKDIDTGKILLQEKVQITETDTAGTLHDRLMFIGSGLVLRTVEAITQGEVEPISQDQIQVPGDLPLAPKISKTDCRINWTEPVGKIYDFVRGLNPYPAAWTILHSSDRSVKLKIFEVEKIEGTRYASPGRVVVIKNDLVIGAGDGSVVVRKIQAEGKKLMSGSEFVKGFRPAQEASCL